MTIFLMILLIAIIVIINLISNKANTKNEELNINQQYDLSKYERKQYVMTQTELKFYRILKRITDELELTIFPQVDLERIIKVTDNNNQDRNKIKSRSIDFTIVNNKNCQIISCIELDDYTHNREKAKKADQFKNNLFQKVSIPLHRIVVTNNYNSQEIKELLQKDLIKKDNKENLRII